MPIRKHIVKILAWTLFLALIFACFYFVHPTANVFFAELSLQRKLRTLASQSDAIVIHYNFSRELPDIILSGDDIKEFFSLLKLQMPPYTFHCLCIGELQITFRKAGKDLASISYHHGKSVRGLPGIKTSVYIAQANRDRLRDFLIKKQVDLKH